jgi:hypothetical protein
MKPAMARTSIVRNKPGAPTMRLHAMMAFFTALICSGLLAESAKPEAAYTWKNGELFRYEYLKTILIKQPDESGRMEERRTEINAVLIIEIKSVTAAGAAATLRFDSPRVAIPTIRFFSAQYDAVEEQADKTRSVARAIEGAIKTARWTVLLKTDGAIHIESRTPTSINDWLKDTANSGGWRKKSQEAMLKLLEQDLGLKTNVVDRETFLCFNPPSEPASTDSDSLHPVRTHATVSSQKDDKALLSFQRVFNKKPDAPYVLPQLTTSSNIKVKAEIDGISVSDGSGIFDTKLGMLDSLSEDYTTKVKYVSGKDSLAQEVRVQYKLKRLAPAIVKNE